MSTWPFAAANFPFFSLKQMRKPYASPGSICALVGFRDTFYDAGSSRVFIHSCSAVHLKLPRSLHLAQSRLPFSGRFFFHLDAQQWPDGKIDAIYVLLDVSVLLLHATAIPSQLFVLRRHFERASCPAHTIVYLPIPISRGVHSFRISSGRGGTAPPESAHR